MNTKIIISLILLCFTFNINAQTEDANHVTEKLEAIQTTQDEYDYMMLGCKEQAKFNLETKVGYKFTNAYSEKINGFKFISRDLIRLESNQYVGTVIRVIAPNKKEEYIAIPHVNEKLMKIHKVHLTYIFKKKQLWVAYSEFCARKTAISGAKTY